MGQSSLSPSPVQLFHLVRLDLSKEGRMSSTVCYKCNRTGHFARECSRAVALMVGRAASADLVEDAEAAVADHVVVVAAAASAGVSHHATTATNPVTLPVSAPNLEPRLATTAARTVTSLATVTLLIAVELVAVVVAMVETEAAIAIAAANLDTFPVIAQMVDQVAVVVTGTDVSATLAVDLVTFLVTALRARTVVEMTKVEMNPATDSR